MAIKELFLPVMSIRQMIFWIEQVDYYNVCRMHMTCGNTDWILC